jgi:hypothetical protein
MGPRTGVDPPAEPLIAASATAGTGIGGVFNLGRTNIVNAKTTLTAGPRHRSWQWPIRDRVRR